MKIAEILAPRSTCQRLKVGCVITNEKMTNILSIGFNGNWAGGPNKCDQKEEGNCLDVHAEINALIKCPWEENRNRIVFLTHSPCVVCSKVLINARIKEVYYETEYRDPSGLNLLRKAGIPVHKLIAR